MCSRAVLGTVLGTVPGAVLGTVLGTNSPVQPVRGQMYLDELAHIRPVGAELVDVVLRTLEYLRKYTVLHLDV